MESLDGLTITVGPYARLRNLSNLILADFKSLLSVRLETSNETGGILFSTTNKKYHCDQKVTRDKV